MREIENKLQETMDKLSVKEETIEKFRVRVAQLEEQVSNASEGKIDVQSLMDSLNEERWKNKELQDRLGAIQEQSKPESHFFESLNTLEQTNTLLMDLNLSLSDKLLQLDQSYQSKLSL